MRKTNRHKKSLAKNSSRKISPKKKSPDKKKESKNASNGLFPVVAIGASAGGFEPISKLLEKIPSDLGMAYIILQHLSPDHESILPELLERKTKMKVYKVEDNMQVSPDNVYVIPPNAFMSIVDSKLKLFPRIKLDGLNHTIDFFLNALAPVYKNKAIAVILSGTASDGTIGVQAIKAEGGITFAQDETAGFQGMPQNAIDSGFIDFVLSPEEIASELKDLTKSPNIVINDDEEIRINDNSLKKIHELLLQKRNVDFSQYKQTTINRRIIRRMTLNHLTRSEDYIQLLKKNNNEINLLYKDLLIVVTNFFRDPASLNALTKKIFPALFRNRKDNEPVRIWVPACATGEEAYSIAIALFEFLKDKTVQTSIQIFATDLNEHAIEKARLGLYSKSFLQNVSPERLKKYFNRINGNYQVTKAIRDVCIFAVHDLLKDPPFSRMDIISCQNIMIYLEAHPQKKILQSFHYALKPSGFLLLGKSETIGSSSELFSQADKDLKIYTKQDVNHLHFDFPMHGKHFSQANIAFPKKIPANNVSEVDIEKESNRLLLSRYAPSSVVVNKDLQIVRFNGDVSLYFQPTAGKASLHLLKMAKDDLVFELKNLTHKAKKENKSVKKEKLHLLRNNKTSEIDIEVIPIRALARDPYYLIIFRESKTSPPPGKKSVTKKIANDTKDKQIISLEQQLQVARDQMKIMSEEFEATREELQSSNEEVLSSNEELQSVNEELETSTEELQSTNEELTTINEELQRGFTSLKESVEYSETILQTIVEPLVVLDIEMRIRIANDAFHENFRTSEEEVQGFNFFAINNGQWHIPGLRKMLDDVINKNKSFHHFELKHSFPKLGEKFLMLSAVRLNKIGNRQDQVLLIIEDLTTLKKAEEQQRENAERFKMLVQNIYDIITILSKEGVITYESDSVKRLLGYEPGERIGKNIFRDTIIHPDDLEKKIDAFRKAIATPNELIKTEFRLQHKDGSYRDIEAVYVNQLDEPYINGIVANYHDVTEQKKLERLREEFVGIASHELKTPVTSLKAYTQVLLDNFEKANDPGSTELLGKLNTQVDRLNTLVGDLLDFTRLERGQLKFRNEEYELNELVKEVTEELQRTTRQHRIELNLDEPIKLNGDHFRIGQAITNLLSNAIKYSPDAKKIIVSTKRGQKDVTICVKDFGIGIDKEVADRVFDRFFRGGDAMSNTFPGLGLGLYITSEIIHRHGGKISVKSEKGNGSTFCFSLPISN